MRNFGLLAEDDIKPSENPLITTMDKRGKENQQQHHIHSRIWTELPEVVSPYDKILKHNEPEVEEDKMKRDVDELLRVH